ncbi:hypothetical protein HPP92_023787 [Vanilla planifolia]|uniref:Uncharacterized protein n=1 Tax=Vanilla planifolia TaxID=51239 RepID=A0A835UAY1_VANPL|nr:hypothetical protein HPP92_023787 [Vanilla planifolia]
MEDAHLTGASSLIECRHLMQGFQPSVWGDYFIENKPMSPLELEQIELKINELKPVLSQALNDTTNVLQSLEFIDTIQHLGVAYHFELEIKKTLITIHKVGIEYTNDLHTIALAFRLLRQQRLPISADVFHRFLDKEGEFMTSLTMDVEALLSLYEASYLGTPNEEIMKKATNFAKRHLGSMCTNFEPNMRISVSRALRTPRFRRMERLEAREFISLYEKQVSKREDLLEFAKFDFLWVQAIHLEELRSISIWKKNIDLAKQLSFARDRSVESHFSIVGIFFEPCYSHARKITTKVVVLTSILNDIYDQYGTLEELQLLTNTINRWDMNEGVELLPMYLQKYILVLYRTFKEFEDELVLEQRAYRVQYLKEEMKKVSRAYFQVKQWGTQSYVPNVKDHMEVSLKSCGYQMLSCCSYVGMIEIMPEEMFQWVKSFPEIVKAACIICRMMDDLTLDEHDQRVDHLATTIETYMEEYNYTKEEACKKLLEMAENAWKTLNQELLLLTNIPLSLVRPIINISRVTALFYRDKDDYTHPQGTMRDNIKLVMLEPIFTK